MGTSLSFINIDRFGFTSMGSFEGKKLEEKLFFRVKGMLFVNGDYPVTHNSESCHVREVYLLEMHIVKENPAFKSLKKAGNDRKLEREFRKWLRDCHVQLDQEVDCFLLRLTTRD